METLNNFVRSVVKLLLTLFLILNLETVLCQDIQLAILAPPPHPSLLSEFEAVSSNYRVNIINLNVNQDYAIYLKARLSSDNGIEVELNEDYVDYEVINIRAGSNETYLMEELGGFFNNVSIDDIDYSGGPDVDYLIQSQRLPDGVYTICMEARNAVDDAIVSLPLAANCSNPIIIQSINPPVIINPFENEVIAQVDPTFFNINWTPVIAPTASIVYDLRIAEYNELVNPYDAIEDQNFLQFEETNLRNNAFVYNQSHPLLVEGRQYIVRVKARDENNSVNIFNQGWSDVVVFTFGEQDNNDGNPPIQNGNFECMTPCTPINIPNAQIKASIDIGDIFQLGNFQLQIDEYQQTVNGFSGSGVIKSSNFIPRDINVAFEDIQINSDNIVTAGVARGLRKAIAESFPRVDELTQNSNVDDALVARIYNEILDPAAEMISEDINESLEGVSGPLSLPISFGEGEYKIHIPDMEFGAQGTQISLLTGYKFEGDYQMGDKPLIFGHDNICITPGGLAPINEVVRLTVINSQNFSPSEAMTININGSDERNPSYIDVDCDGINRISIHGDVAIDRNYAVPVDEEGNVLEYKTLAFGFDAEFFNWDDMIINASNNQIGENGNKYFSSSFALKSFPEFKFTFEDFTLDLSENINDENTSFPPIYNQNENWIGLYFGNVQMGFPDYFEHDASTISVELRELIFDESGASFQFSANGLESLADISLGGWGMNLSAMNLIMIRNQLIQSSISGAIDLPFCENPIGVGGRISHVRNRLDYNLSFDVREDWEVPMWACKFKCNNQSRLLAKVEGNEFKIIARVSGELELDEGIADFDNIKIKEVRFEDMEFSSSAPYFSPGNFDIDAVARASFLGFSINIEDIDVGSIHRPGVIGELPQLKFDIGFKFGEKGVADAAGMYISTDSELSLTAIKNQQTGNYDFDNIQLEQIHIQSEVGTVRMDGYLDVYRNHEIYGNGFDGLLDLTFLGDLSMQGRLLLGSKDDFDYWFASAGVIFEEGIDFVPPVKFQGFSGGAYYNMNQRTIGNNPVGESSVEYIPKKDGWGLKAGVVWALSPISSTMNGNVDLLVDMGRGGSLRSVTLEGRAKMLDSPSFTKIKLGDSEMVFDGNITYNHDQGSLSAVFGYKLDIPRGTKVIEGGSLNDHSIDLFVQNANNWHLYLGRPDPSGSLNSMLDFNLNLGTEIRGKYVGIKTGINGYFNIGSSIPATPPLPQRAADIIRGRGYIGFIEDRSGVGAGLHVAFSTGKIGFDYGIVGLQFDASAGFGVDMSYALYDNYLCNGSEYFGINKWYFDARAYLYASAGLRGKLFGTWYNLARASLGATMTLAGPQPFYGSGRFRVRVILPIIDPITFGVGVSIGERCEFTSDDDMTDDQFIDELSETMIVGELQNLPNEDVDFTDQNIKIDAKYFVKPNVVQREDFNNVTIEYKVNYNIQLKKKENGNWVNHKFYNQIEHLKFDDGLVEISLNRGVNNERLLDPGSEYKLIVSGTLLIKKSGEAKFKVARSVTNEVVGSVREFEFETLALGDFEINVVDVIPQRDRQNFHVDDVSNAKGFITLNRESNNLLNRLGFPRYAQVEFKFTEYFKSVNITTGNVYTLTGTTNPWEPYKIYFLLNQLREGFSYKMDVMLTYEDEDPIVVYTQNFKTSMYSEIEDKIRETLIDDIVVEGANNSGNYYQVMLSGEEAYEANYEDMELMFLSSTVKGPQSYMNRRFAMENFAQEHGFINHIKLFYPEIIRRPLNGGNNNNQNNNPLFANLVPDLLAGLNLEAPIVMKFTWRPNDYLLALKNYAIQNHFGAIYGNPELEAIFFRPLPLLEEEGGVNFEFKHTSSSKKRTIPFYF